MQEGFKNEYNFISHFNKRKFKELDFVSQDLFRALYPDIEDDDIILAGKYKEDAKADLIVDVKGYKKGISIKTGSNCSAHLEKIDTFIEHLELFGFKSGNLLKRYLYGDGTDNNTGFFRVSAAEYKKDHADEIAMINEEIDKYRYPLIHKFLFDYHEDEKIKVSAIIWGKPYDYFYATEKEIMNYLMFFPKRETSGVCVSNLFIQNWNRNLKYNPDREWDRNFVQIKWYDCADDLFKITAYRLLYSKKKQKLTYKKKQHQTLY